MAFSTRADGQRLRFDDPFQLSPGAGFQQPPATPPTVLGGPSIITSPAPVFGSPPAISASPPVTQLPQLNPGTFNPNSIPLPNLPQIGSPIVVNPPPLGQQPIVPQGSLNGPIIQVPPQDVIFPPQQPGPGYGTYQLRNQWPYQSPGSNWWPSLEWPSQVWARLRSNVLPRFLERPRFRHTYIHGDPDNPFGNDLGINDLELATTATIPNWFNSGQPLRISPNFIFHFWDGPDTALSGFQLPAQTYSTFLSFDYISDPRRPGGIETNLAIGVYTDFEHVASESLRITGSAIGWRRINSYTTAKLGVEYLNRVRVKLLPAFGVFMAPNPDLKIDLYFPRPKIAHRLPSYRGLEAWLYSGAEYGGGSWTAADVQGATMMVVGEDQFDYNDVRAFVGVEWLGPQRVTGFFEVGYVFEREVVLRSDGDTLNLRDSIMLRSGLAF
ncbi:MAG: hypothetical protein AAF456_21105 [Planctomycetota bacterium]